ncbi:hypothetical protein RCL_jg13822.t1 [Rhizophagus clarus]|uniref:Uncharacterized protein n=1 Tax=Rhizophagus clarus TaxID=94130 RepID=A0A8H3LST1_9GLOM|nr:hypothetical protein RCL_jg13822.t1 [Rhizophagus clarus]
MRLPSWLIVAFKQASQFSQGNPKSSYKQVNLCTTEDRHLTYIIDTQSSISFLKLFIREFPLARARNHSKYSEKPLS